MHTRLYAGSLLKQDSFERAQALGLEGKMGKTGRTERAKRAKRHAIFSARSLPVKRNGTGTETEHFFDAYCIPQSYHFSIMHFCFTHCTRCDLRDTKNPNFLQRMRLRPHHPSFLKTHPLSQCLNETLD